MEIIRLPEILNVLHQWDGEGNPVPFGPITFVTCDKRRGKGGEKITLQSAVLVGGAESKADKYNPEHYQNFTRNIRATDGNRIIKLRIHLITRFNGYKVTL